MIFKKSILILLTTCFVQQLSAQSAPSTKLTVDKNRILIGEPLRLTYEISIDTGAMIRFPLLDTIPHFEILGQPSLDKSFKGRVLSIKEVYTITSFDSGRWVIPSFTLVSGTKRIKTDTIPIDVVFSDFDPAQQYHDIKDILEVDAEKKQFPWWWYAAGGAVLIALTIYLLKRRKPVKPVIPKVSINPYEEAMKELEQLKLNKPNTKLYYTKLTDIFRLYLYRKKGLLSLQKTTDDLVIQLKGLNMDKEQFEKLSQSLRLSDFVKFAKYVPAVEDDNSVFRDVENAIKTIEQTVAQ